MFFVRVTKLNKLLLVKLIQEKLWGRLIAFLI